MGEGEGEGAGEEEELRGFDKQEGRKNYFVNHYSVRS